jgi:POT family proton-dependent oligopeptide transporter
MAVLALLYFSSLLFFGKLSVADKKRVVLIFVFFLAAVLFWSGYEQAGSSMNLFAERLTNRVIAGWEMPASWLQAVNPVFIIVLAPVVGFLWVWLRSREPSTPAKMGYGLALLAIGFLVLAWGATFTISGAKVSPMWLIVTYFLHTVGELCLSPVGLSSVTKLAPRRLVGQLMGTWFMGTALGNLIAGLAGGGFEGMTTGEMFAAVAKVTGVAGLILLLFSRQLKRLMGGESGQRIGAVPVVPEAAASDGGRIS